MHFTFIKEYLGSYYISGPEPVQNACVYRISDGGKEIGEYFHSQNFLQIRFGERDIFVNAKWRLFKKIRYPITDNNTKENIGEFRLPQLFGRDKLLLGENVYRWKNMPPEIEYQSFKRATWGYYKIKMYSKTEECIYSLQVGQTGFFSRSPDVRPLSGDVHYTGNDPLPAFAGLFFVERMLEFKSRRD